MKPTLRLLLDADGELQSTRYNDGIDELSGEEWVSSARGPSPGKAVLVYLLLMHAEWHRQGCDGPPPEIRPGPRQSPGYTAYDLVDKIEQGSWLATLFGTADAARRHLKRTPGESAGRYGLRLDGLHVLVESPTPHPDMADKYRVRALARIETRGAQYKKDSWQADWVTNRPVQQKESPDVESEVAPIKTPRVTRDDVAFASPLASVLGSAVAVCDELDDLKLDVSDAHVMLERAASNYCDYIESRYGLTKVLGMTEPMRVRDIYVRLNVLPHLTRKRRLSKVDIEARKADAGRGPSAVDGAVPADEVVDSKFRLLVLGKPGSGKTTFLRRTALRAIDGNCARESVPVFVGLKDLSDSGKSLDEYVAGLFRVCGLSGLPDPRVFAHALLSSGHGLVLLDGLDEVSDRPAEMVRQIREFVDRYNKNQFIVTCRRSVYGYGLEDFFEAELADFDEAQIEAFVRSWFGPDERTADSCLEAMRSSPAIGELASVPLLLTLLCITFDELLDFPANRGELYQEAVDVLLKKWDTSRRIKRPQIYRGLSRKRKESLLSRIAAEFFEAGEYLIKKRDLERAIEKYLHNLGKVDVEPSSIDAESVLLGIEAQHGLIVERWKGVYSYSHLSLHEFFTARYIVDNEARGATDRLVESHFGDQRWREVFLIVAGLLDDAGPLLLAMRQHAAKGLGASSLSIIKSSAEVVRDTGKEFQACALVALGYIANNCLLVPLESLLRRQRRAVERARTLETKRRRKLKWERVDLSGEGDGESPAGAKQASVASKGREVLESIARLAGELRLLDPKLFSDRHQASLEHAITGGRVPLEFEESVDRNLDGLPADSPKAREVKSRLAALKSERKKDDELLPFLNTPLLHSQHVRLLGMGIGRIFAIQEYGEMTSVAKEADAVLGELLSYVCAAEAMIACLRADCYVDRDVRGKLLQSLLKEPSSW